MKLCFLLIISIFSFVACQIAPKNKDLIGEWKYTKFECLNQNLDCPTVDLPTMQPSIVFQKNGKAAIYSSGKILSKGTYYLEDEIIRYEEVLPNGQQRKIPFLIKKINQNELVFETMETQVKRVTAKKQKNNAIKPI